MRLYLVQHGEAEPRTRNPDRPLTKQGRDDVSRVAAFSREAGVDLHQILHSGIRRAGETALILAQALEPEAGTIARSGLAPRDDVRPVAELVNLETRTLMFVGHGPFMERLVGLLVAQDEGMSVVRFERGGIVCLERSAKPLDWRVLWIITPELVPKRDSVDR